MSGAGVEVRGLSHGFPETGAVLESIDLKIAPGEFIALLGPSGCGKSTLLRLIAGLATASSGSIDVRAAAGFSRGFVFQEAQLLPWQSVLDNAALPLTLLKHPPEEARAKARDALVKVGLGDALAKYPNQLSGGMKMRVSVARALVSEPALLLLDEPFAALDENTRERLQEDLRALWEKLRMTVVFVTHSVGEAAFLANRIVAFSSRPGRVILDRASPFGETRNEVLRRDPSYWREIGEIGAVYRAGGARR